MFWDVIRMPPRRFASVVFRVFLLGGDSGADPELPGGIILSGLGTPWSLPGGAGDCCWGGGDLGFSPGLLG